jgi:hypothetical protein
MADAAFARGAPAPTPVEPAGQALGDTPRESAQIMFDQLGSDGLGAALQQSLCEGMFVSLDGGTSPALFWQDISRPSCEPRVDPRTARSGLAERCGFFVDASYRGPDRVPPVRPRRGTVRRSPTRSRPQCPWADPWTHARAGRTRSSTR